MAANLIADHRWEVLSVLTVVETGRELVTVDLRVVLVDAELDHSCPQSARIHTE